MRLYDEIFKNADGGGMERCVIVPAGGGYFEGVKSVGDFSPEKIQLYFSKTTVEIVGAGLEIKKYYDGDLQIQGKIAALSVLADER